MMPASRGGFAPAAILAVCVLLLAWAGAVQAAALCSTTRGGRVTLASDAVDPDVFLWDSRQRLVDYAAGQWGSTKEIIAHTLLADPGTEAVIVSCVSAAAHPRYAVTDEDAVGVRIMSGPHRGRYGWVLSSDIRSVQASGGQSASASPKGRP